jgi:hypothetical protein
MKQLKWLWLMPFLTGLIWWANPSTSAKQVVSSDGWVEVFNGKNLDGWIAKIHKHPVGANFAETFRAKDGMIQVRYDGYDQFDDQFGHLYIDKPYGHFHLKLEYQFVGDLHPGAPSYTLLNSGVMFHAQDPKTMLVDQDWPISVEMQFLAGLGDGQPRPTGNMCSPGTHIHINGRQARSHCVNSTSKTYGKDEWVRAELIVLGDSLITHVINGDTVLQYSHPQIGGDVVNGYDPAIKIDGTPLKSGYIGLQSEGQAINFRNIYIKDLTPIKSK